MKVHVHDREEDSVRAAADELEALIVHPDTGALMVAGGNTPLGLYAEIARRRPLLSQLSVFCLDEYLGVPADHPRTCANLLRRTVAGPWGIPPERFFALPTAPALAAAAVAEHERRIAALGGLSVVVLGLGRNGHLGFNEPGSAEDAPGRVVPLEPVSIEANRRWFGGDHAPDAGVTTGLATVLAARHVVLQAYGAAKAEAAAALVSGPRSPRSPASFLQTHPRASIYLDTAAASA